MLRFRQKKISLLFITYNNDKFQARAITLTNYIGSENLENPRGILPTPFSNYIRLKLSETKKKC